MKNKTGDKRTEKDRLTDDIVGLMIHSYNNYLAGLIGFTELALLDCRQQDIKDCLNMALNSGSEAVIFGNQLLSSVGRLRAVLKPVELKSLLTELCDNNEKLSSDIFVLNDQNELSIKTDRDWFLYCLQSMVDFCNDYSKIKLSKRSQVELRILTGENFEMSESDGNNFVTLIFATEIELNLEQIECLFYPFIRVEHCLLNKVLGLRR